MVKVINIFLLAFYSFGTLCLPTGNFSALQELPEMYQHCKATEDKDMTPLDFITDHLLNLDGIFDKHNSGDEQKPHSPIHNQPISQITAFQFRSGFNFKIAHIFFEKKLYFFHSDNFIKSGYISNVFRPPIVVI